MLAKTQSSAAVIHGTKEFQKMKTKRKRKKKKEDYEQSGNDL